MKKSFFAGLAMIAISCATQALQAAPTTGNFKPGTTFNLKVISVSSVQTTSAGSVTVAVPKGIPKFSVGQTVKFTIGKQTQLKAPGVSINFQGASTASNLYVNPINIKLGTSQSGTVYKNVKGMVTGASLNFTKLTQSTNTSNAVLYLFGNK
jgi:hypothetical protein